MAQQLRLREERTLRNGIVYHQDHRHVPLEELKRSLEYLQENYPRLNMITYLEKNIPNYPKPEFSVSRLKHETPLKGLRGIQKSGGFKGSQGGRGQDRLLWWSLHVGPEEIREAKVQGANQEFPLWRFATSPAFTETSSLGSFRFTFTVQEVLEQYKAQICSGKEPVMRVYRTSLFPQKIQYTILIHSPKHKNTFSEYPLLENKPDAICSYRDGRFIWRSQAMCETHRYTLTDSGQVVPVSGRPQFYVYDSVAIALHMEKTQVLKFDQNLLRMNLRFCHRGPEAYGQHVNEIFMSPKDAEREVRQLWPDEEETLEEDRSLQEKFADSNLRLVLLGESGEDMSRYADHILKTNTFTKVFKENGGLLYWRQSGEVFNRFVTVLKTPQLSEWRNSSNEDVEYFKEEASRADAVLLVIRRRPSAQDVDNLIEVVESQLGETVWGSTILLLAAGRKRPEQSPELQSPELQKLLVKVQRRYVRFSSSKVETLLKMVEKMERRPSSSSSEDEEDEV